MRYSSENPVVQVFKAKLIDSQAELARERAESVLKDRAICLLEMVKATLMKRSAEQEVDESSSAAQ
eukprot:scaffold5834_cov376-Prasinococcus_capsulatus_cf.AAC.6